MSWGLRAGAEPEVTGRTIIGQSKVAVNQPCQVEYLVQWQGARDACVVLPLDLTQPDWGTATLKETRTEHEGDQWRVTQVVDYTASKAGKFVIPAVEVQMITSNQPIVGAFESTPATKVKMDEVSITVTSPARRQTYGLAAGAVVALLVGLVGLVCYRRRHMVKPAEGLDAVAVARELLHDARRCRLDGDFYACYQSLLKSAEAMQTEAIEAKNAADSIRSRIPAVGFQGVRPTDDEMDSVFRDIERIIARRNAPPVPEQEK